jgi:hypothetical protein
MNHQMDASWILEDLQAWYLAQCDGDWEHSFGIDIGTLDNPGWTVRIDLEGTILESKGLEEIQDLAPEDDWISCKVENKKFVGAGGPHQLTKLLEVFLHWAQSEADWLATP